MIPAYPHFSKLDLSLRESIVQFTQQFEPYSDFNFTSLFCWNTDGSTEVSLLNGNLVIRMPDYLDGHTTVYSILGNQKIDGSVDTLLKATEKLQLIPEPVIKLMANASGYSVLEDEDNFDYIYDLAHLHELPGSKFKKKRNMNNVFIRDHEDYELTVKTVGSVDHEHSEMIKAVDRHWATLNPRDKGDILAERRALDILLDNFNDFRLVITEVWVDGEIKAFSINEVIDDNYAICHFEKALKTHHENINTFLVNEVARRLRQEGCKWVNWEQDLGLEGLRKSKRSYGPTQMLRKYTVTKT